jgi:hypothetical protein
MVRVPRKRYSADECTDEVTGMDVAALVIAIIGVTTGVAGVDTAVISIRIARRSATADDVTAIATKTATEVAQRPPGRGPGASRWPERSCLAKQG